MKDAKRAAEQSSAEIRHQQDSANDARVDQAKAIKSALRIPPSTHSMRRQMNLVAICGFYRSANAVRWPSRTIRS
jgi:hypothetical protein